MHYVRHLDATGLNLFASAVKKTVGSPASVSLDIDLPENHLAASLVANCGVPEMLQLGGQGSLLVGNQRECDSKRSNAVASRIIEIRNRGADQRSESLFGFRNELKTFLNSAQAKLNRQQILLIFSEMVKNTLDHSDRDATLGIDLDVSVQTKSRLSFSYCEQGLGLSKSLRAHLKENREYVGRALKGGFSDLMHWALQPGNSTKSGNGVNFGLGMSMILAAANGIGLTVELIDAASVVSLAGLSERHSHLDLRRRFVSCSDFPCFSYVGELTHD